MECDVSPHFDRSPPLASLQDLEQANAAPAFKIGLSGSFPSHGDFIRLHSDK